MSDIKSKSIKPFDLFVFLFSFLSLIGAILLAIYYANSENPLSVPFLLRPDTYDIVLPFLLGTVAIGGFALVYNRLQSSKEKMLAQRNVAKASLEMRIKRLQDIYETVLANFQNVRLQRRRLQEAFIMTNQKGEWKIRRGLFEEISTRLSEAQLSSERIIKTFEFEKDTLIGELDSSESEIERLRKLQDDLKSQIGGIQGVLRNVLRTSEWQSITAGSSSEEDLIVAPDGFVKFAERSSTGTLGFRQIGLHYDAFASNIIMRIRELEAEAISLG